MIFFFRKERIMVMSLLFLEFAYDQESQRESFSYLLTPPPGQDMTQGQFLSGV